MHISLRKATLPDLHRITALFRDTIIGVKDTDYNLEQRTIWASGWEDIPKWYSRIDTHHFIVAVLESKIVGFAYLKDSDYFDGLFVHPQYQRMGVAKTLAQALKKKR